MERETGYFKPMQELPRVSVDDKNFSETVIVYGEELDDHDFGYYDFTDNTWNVLGDFGMKMICWSYPEMPVGNDVQGFQTIETPVYKKTRIPAPDEKSVIENAVKDYAYHRMTDFEDFDGNEEDFIENYITHNLKQRKP